MPEPYLTEQEINAAVMDQTKSENITELITKLRSDKFRGLLMGQRCAACGKVLLAFVGSATARAKIDPSFHIRIFPGMDKPPQDVTTEPTCPICRKATDVISPAKAEIIYDGSPDPWKLKYPVVPRYRLI